MQSMHLFLRNVLVPAASEFPQRVEGVKISCIYLSHLLDLGAPLPDERATLAGRDHQPQGDGGLAGRWAVAHRVDDVLT